MLFNLQLLRIASMIDAAGLFINNRPEDVLFNLLVVCLLTIIEKVLFNLQLFCIDAPGLFINNRPQGGAI